MGAACLGTRLVRYSGMDDAGIRRFADVLRRRLAAGSDNHDMGEPRQRSLPGLLPLHPRMRAQHEKAR